MSFRLVQKSVSLNDLERRNGRCMRYFTDFGKSAFQHNLVDLWRNICTILLFFL